VATKTNPTIPETVTLPADVILDAIAALQAFSEYDAELAPISRDIDGQAGSSVSEWCVNLASRVQAAAFGEIGDEEVEDGDEAWHRFPAEVERHARGAAMAAELLKLHMEDEGDDYLRRADRLIRHGENVRERGTINV
jgi:hypothetical protein